MSRYTTSKTDHYNLEDYQTTPESGSGVDMESLYAELLDLGIPLDWALQHPHECRRLIEDKRTSLGSRTEQRRQERYEKFQASKRIKSKTK